MNLDNYLKEEMFIANFKKKIFLIGNLFNNLNKEKCSFLKYTKDIEFLF